LDEGEFTEGHELDRKWKVAKEMVGRRLSQEEAKRLLAKFTKSYGRFCEFVQSFTKRLIISAVASSAKREND